MKAIKYLFLICIATIQTHAQLIDVFQAHVGSSIFPASEQINLQTGKPDNIYGGFTPALVLGVGVTKFITDKFQVVGRLDIMGSQKPNYSLNLINTSINLKYSIISPDIYRLSPYIIAGGNFMYVTLNQSSFTRLYEPDGNYNGQNGIVYNQITYREPQYSFFSPMFGVNAGIGLDINVYNNISIFFESTYQFNFAKDSGIQNNKIIDYNRSDLVFIPIIGGVRVYMY